MKRDLLKVFLVVAAFVATSCFDNSEPEGLQGLREAKSELIKANAAVQLAEAELRKAEALGKEAEARMTTAQAEALEIANAIQSARNEAEKKELELKLERLVEQQKRDLVQLQTETARWEAEYRKALIDLEATLATYRNSKYAGELALVLQDLTEARNQITSIRNRIAAKQGELLSYVSRDSLATNRMILSALTTAQKNYDLGVEKAALLKEARDGNVDEWGAKRDKMQQRKKEMELAWTNMEPQAREWAQQQRELQIKNNELTYTLDGDYAKYAQNAAQLGMQPNPNLDVAQTLTFTVPTSLQPFFESQVGGFIKEGDRYSKTIDGVTGVLQELKVGVVFNGSELYYYVDDIPEYAMLYGLLPAVERWTLSSSKLMDAKALESQYKEGVTRTKEAYEAERGAYTRARDKYIGAAEAYDFDWTLTDNTRRTLWFATRNNVSSFYANYDSNLAADPGYVPSDIELRAITSQIANYLKKRVALTCEYDLDPIVLLDPMDDATRMRLSEALVAIGTQGDAFRMDYLITSDKGRSVMGFSENLRWNISQSPDSERYDSTLSELAESMDRLYGLSYSSGMTMTPLMLIDLDPDTDLMVIPTSLVNTDYTQVHPNNYEVWLNEPISNIPNTNTTELSQLNSGTLHDYLTARAALRDMTLLISLQYDLNTLMDTLTEKRRLLLEVYRAGVAELKVIGKTIRDLTTRYDEMCYTTDITDTSTAAYMTYSYCDMMFALLDGYINKASITLSDGSKYDVMADIDQAIKDAEQAIDPNTPGGLYEKLEAAKANLKVWMELGYNGSDSAIGMQLRAAIADLQAELAEQQAEFERCSELKDKLIGLMKAE